MRSSLTICGACSEGGSLGTNRIPAKERAGKALQKRWRFEQHFSSDYCVCSLFEPPPPQLGNVSIEHSCQWVLICTEVFTAYEQRHCLQIRSTLIRQGSCQVVIGACRGLGRHPCHGRRPCRPPASPRVPCWLPPTSGSEWSRPPREPNRLPPSLL